MFTIFVVFVFVVLMVPLGIAAQRLLFKEADEVCDPQWELYQQRYDECGFPQAAGRDAPGRGPEREAAACSVAHGTGPHRPEAGLRRASSSERSTPMLTTPARYRIRVQGHLGAQWADWFGGFTLSWQEPGETVFVGQIIDQAALHGLLNAIRDLGLPLLEVQRLEPGAASEADL